MLSSATFRVVAKSEGNVSFILVMLTGENPSLSFHIGEHFYPFRHMAHGILSRMFPKPVHFINLGALTAERTLDSLSGGVSFAEIPGDLRLHWPPDMVLTLGRSYGMKCRRTKLAFGTYSGRCSQGGRGGGIDHSSNNRLGSNHRPPRRAVAASPAVIPSDSAA